MRKSLIIILFIFSVPGIESYEEPDILPEYALAFPFGSIDYKNKISMGLENANVWSENRIMAWAQSQGFTATKDNPQGGFQYRRGIIFHSPGIRFKLRAPETEQGENLAYGWKIYLDFCFFYSPSLEESMVTNFSSYENLLRYEIFIDNILFKTIEIGYGVTERSPVILEIPYLRDPSGNVSVEIRLKNHPANFGILYDAFLSQE